MIEEILAEKSVSQATHPLIRCYRVRSTEKRGVVIESRNDDGESGAGDRLLRLLSMGHSQMENVFVGVTRWYGGKPLGPTRFKMISTAAKDALAKLVAEEEKR